MRFSAVELFNDRAVATVDGFVLDDADVPEVLEICRRLDGVPLALELAAARVDAFGVKGLAARLDDRFAVPTKGRRTPLPRHRTLRAAIDWSYDLLPEIEQVVFRRLAVFRGRFTVEAAAAVAADERLTPAEVIERVANLAAKSLVATDISGDITYHRLLDTTRCYALEKLTGSGEAEQAGRRHAEFFRALIAPAVSGSQRKPTTEEIVGYGREIDNVRAALDWGFSPVGDPSIGVALTAAYVPVWLNLALMVECAERTERALDSLERDLNLSVDLRMRLHTAFGDALIHSTGFVERTGTVLAAAVETAKAWVTWSRSCALYGPCGAIGSTSAIPAQRDPWRIASRKLPAVAATQPMASWAIGSSVIRCTTVATNARPDTTCNACSTSMLHRATNDI